MNHLHFSGGNTCNLIAAELFLFPVDGQLVDTGEPTDGLDENRVH